MTCLAPRTSCLFSFALGFAAILAGCGTPASSPITVKSDLARAAVSASDKKYVLAFANRASEQILLPHRLRVDAALAQLGYQPALPMDAAVVVHLFAEENRRIYERRVMHTAASYEALNPDSTRFKNVAGMVPGGRYEHMLNDRPTNEGQVFIGPENEIRRTGDQQLDEQQSAHAEEREIPRKINRLVLVAHELPLPADPSQATVRWRVEVVGNVSPGDPSPSMDQLVNSAIQNLGKQSHGAKPAGS